MDLAEQKEKHLKIREDVATREMDGETFFVTPGDWKLHRLNEVGKRIWELANEGKKISEIIDEIVEEYGADKEIVEKDCLVFVEELCEKGIAKFI